MKKRLVGKKFYGRYKWVLVVCYYWFFGFKIEFKERRRVSRFEYFVFVVNLDEKENKYIN